MKYYKALSKQFISSSSLVDTSVINYSLSIEKLQKLTDLQKDLLEKVFKFRAEMPVRDSLLEYNERIDCSWESIFKHKVNHPRELQLYQFPWELVYEVIRKDLFPERPKRSESYFVFNELKDAENWAERRSDYVVCEVHKKDFKNSFSGDMNYLDSVEIDSTFEEITESVKKYWAGEISNTPTIETLLQGTFELKPI